MKNQFTQISRTVGKGCLILVSYFLLAACMQHDESIAPGKNNLHVSPSVENDENGQGSLMKNTFTAHLKSSNEVSSTPIISDAQGQAIFKLSEDGQSIEYKLIVANIKGVTQAHIHCGAAGVNAPVIVFLYGFNAAGVDANGVLAEGTLTSASLVATSPCRTTIPTFDALVTRMRNGTVYVNVHTIKYPGGEIRGQIN